MRTGLLLFLLSLNLQASKTFLPPSFTADLEQSHKSSISGKIKSSKGKIFFQDPSKLRIEFAEPNQTVFVSNKTKTWYYRAPLIQGEKGELRIEEKGNTELSKFFDLIKKGLGSNDQYDVVGKGKVQTLVFKETTAKQVGFLEAELVFKNEKDQSFADVESMKIKKLDGQSIDLKFNKLDIGSPLKSDLFQFVVPPNTNISRN
jgi:outer membrane lipoprotein-sorting protein